MRGLEVLDEAGGDGFGDGFDASPGVGGVMLEGAVEPEGDEAVDGAPGEEDVVHDAGGGFAGFAVNVLHGLNKALEAFHAVAFGGRRFAAGELGAEHDAEEVGMPDAEGDVVAAKGKEALGGIGIGKGAFGAFHDAFEAEEGFFGDGVEEGGFVGEVMVGGGLGDADLLGDATEADGIEALLAGDAGGGLDQGFSEAAMVVCRRG